MEALKMLYFVIALLFVIGCISLILHNCHAIEKAEEQEWKRQLRKQIDAIR